ncbi:MAG TPA: hypothetical protein DEF82_02805 [Crocinitomicaceae bacterium]|nr:hypothetical protein [Crocinitomicaceae bacterium]
MELKIQNHIVMGNNRSIEKVIYASLIIVSILLIGDILSLLFASQLHVGYKITGGIIFMLYALVCGGTLSKILTLKK